MTPPPVRVGAYVTVEADGRWAFWIGSDDGRKVYAQGVRYFRSEAVEAVETRMDRAHAWIRAGGPDPHDEPSTHWNCRCLHLRLVQGERR